MQVYTIIHETITFNYITFKICEALFQGLVRLPINLSMAVGMLEVAAFWGTRKEEVPCRSGHSCTE